MSIESVQQPDVADKTQKPNQSVIHLIDEWKDARQQGKTLTNTNEPLTVDFTHPIYHDEMNAHLNQLLSDANSKNPNVQSLNADIAAVSKAANWWTDHEKGNDATSPVTADLGKEMKQMDQALAMIKDGKRAEGQALLKTSSADVADDLNTLQHADWMYRHPNGDSKGKGGGTGPGGGGTGPGGDGPGGGSMQNEQQFNNLGFQPWHYNTTDGGSTGIGGEGNDPHIQTSYNDGVLTYTSTGGKYTDTLISNGQKFNPNDNTFVLNYSMNRDAATAGNAEASENDMVITNNTGMQAQAASQFNYAEKAPPGYTWFQTSNTQGHWVNAALVPTPEPGEDTDVSMTVKLIGNNQYEYTGLTINGKSYQLEPGSTTFQMHQSNWTHNEVITQLQEDTNGNGGPITEYYKDISVDAGYTS